VKSWSEVSGVEIPGITKIMGFGCNEDWLYVNVDGIVSKGLFAWPVGTDEEITQVFTGVGILEVLNSGALVASYPNNNTTAIVGLDAEGNATDMGFTGEAMEVKKISYSGSHLVTMTKDTTTADYMLHRAKLPDGEFEQSGIRLKETGMSIYATPDTVYLLTLYNEVVGTACHRIPLTAGAEDPYEDCPFFPDYADNGGTGSEPYSVNAYIYGEGLRMGLWFRVSNKGEKSASHYVATDKIKWTEVEGIPPIEPTAWHHDGDNIYIGLTGSGGKSAAWTAPYNAEEPATDIGEGLPGTTEKSGVAGICTAGNILYLAWLDHNPGGSTIRIMKRAR
jgi:hypothetical protein